MIKQSTINLVGGLLPAFVSLACIPLILNRHGSEFFGVYSIQTALLMVVGLMDLGVSRGIMLVTYDRDLNPSGTPNKPFKAGLYLALWGALLVLLITLAVLLIIQQLRPTTPDIKLSTFLSLLSGALTILTLPLRALLEIQGKFGVLNIVRSALACSIPLAPLLPGLGGDYYLTISAVYVLIVRIGGLFAYRSVCGLKELELNKVPEATKEWQREFIKRCGWVGLTNVGSLILTYADRLLLASIASTTALASFVIAHELATKIWMVTGAVLSATMPKVAADLMKHDTKFSTNTPPASLTKVRLLILGTIVLPSIILAVFLKYALTIWLGAKYSVDIEVAGKILIAGIALNSMSQFNFGLLQINKGESQGAQLQLFNIAIAVILMAIFIPIYGAIGAAVAFSIRLVVDAYVTRALLQRKINIRAGFLYVDMTVVVSIFLILLMI
jgi:O-antigen/teichoic acid export membrane protein